MSTIDGLADLGKLRGGVVVSCQAREGNPLHGPVYMAAMAAAAMQGGAAGIRADGAADITAIRARIGTESPIIGILKTKLKDGSLFITATAEDALHVIGVGASLVALDGTRRPRPGGESLEQAVAAIHEAGGAALADIDTVESAEYAIACGADAVGTTLSGYTPDSDAQEGPDFALLEVLARESERPVFAEGRIWTREEVRQAFELGASFVVVGTAITNPLEITRRFAAVAPERG
jgi:putative N-acetylmannosamine-6-phosphate epimerase